MKRGLTLVLFVGLCVFWGQGCTPPNERRINPSLQKADSEECVKAISDGINATAGELGYSQRIADEFAGMVLGWKAGAREPAIGVLAGRIAEAKQSERAGRISKTRLAEIERDIAGRLVGLIRRHIKVDDRFFDLADVVKYRKAQCLGYAQVFYITARSIGLEAGAINVLELEKEGTLPVGFSHVACMVYLADGKTTMINVVPGGFISGPFATADTFEPVGSNLQLKDKSNPLGIYRRIAILDGRGLSAYVYSNGAVEHNEGKRFEEAIEAGNRAIQLFPALAEAWNNRGIAYRNTGQVEQAISDYTQALELNPFYQEAWNNRGVAYAQMRRSEESIADYSRAIELNPAFAEAYSNRGNAYAAMRQTARAIADYDRAIEHNPALSQAYGNRALNYAILGKSEQAKKDLAAATRINPELAGFARRISQRFELGLNPDNVTTLAAAK
jgi:tetratricopeptide (TPR) repeat protein